MFMEAVNFKGILQSNYREEFHLCKHEYLHDEPDCSPSLGEFPFSLPRYLTHLVKCCSELELETVMLS